MALLRIELKNYNKGHHNVAQHATYVSRSVAEHAAHNVRQRPQERPKEDLLASGHQHMPPWAQAEPLQYWRDADRYSRRNACLAKEVLVTLPKEFTPEQNVTLVQTFLAQLPAVPTTWAVHQPQTRSGKGPQPHAHILLSPRQDLGLGQGPETYFKQPNHGGVPSLRLWTRWDAVKRLRSDWEQVLRTALRAQGLEHTLARPHTDKEVRLTWREMKDLERYMTRHFPDAWGHESRLSDATLQALATEKKVSVRQLAWLGQRAQRQRAYTLAQLQPDVWQATAQIQAAKPWQLVRKFQATGQQRRGQKTVTELQQQQRTVGAVVTTILQPALAQETARYRQAKMAARMTQRQPTPGRTGGLHVELESPTEQAARLQRQRDTGMER